MRNQLRQSEKG